ncbi:cobalt transporter CbiM [Desulfatiferula olefinivorans]
MRPEILAGAAALTALGVAAGLRRIEDREIPAMGILSAAFFVGSLIHVPAGVVSVHLVLNGLVGFILGIRAFPVILVGLLLQALLFHFGGLTSLGVNTLNMALPAFVCGLAFGWAKKPETGRLTFTVAAFACGALSVLLSGLMVGLTLFLNGQAFVPAAKLMMSAHVPVMIIEGLVTASCLGFLKKVRPEMLTGPGPVKEADA